MKKILAIILGITMIFSTNMFALAKETENSKVLSEYDYSGSKANFNIAISQEKLSDNLGRMVSGNVTAKLVETDLGVKGTIIFYDEVENQHLDITFLNSSDNMVQIEDDNSLLFFDGKKEMIGAANAMSIKDSNGNYVDVSIRINDNVVRYDINDKNAAYPLYGEIEVYGNNDFSQWFSNGEWITRDGKISLSLTHTGWAYLGISTGPITWSWNTVVNKFSGSSNWYNAQGMQEQYQCHVNFAAAKNPWNLEPWRPAVGYIETTKKQCNP